MYFVSSLETQTIDTLEYLVGLDSGVEFAYYDYSRVFLMKEKSKEYSENMSEQLSQLLIASYLVLGSPEALFYGTQEISERRKNFYAAYTLIKYWQYHEIPEFDGALLRGALNEILLDENITGQELTCFIENDIPVLSEQTVFSSANYLDCIQRS